MVPRLCHCWTFSGLASVSRIVWIRPGVSSESSFSWPDYYWPPAIQIRYISHTQGLPPLNMLKVATKTRKFFRQDGTLLHPYWRLKVISEYYLLYRLNNNNDIHLNYRLQKNMKAILVLSRKKRENMSSTAWTIWLRWVWGVPAILAIFVESEKISGESESGNWQLRVTMWKFGSATVYRYSQENVVNGTRPSTNPGWRPSTFFHSNQSSLGVPKIEIVTAIPGAKMNYLMT